MKRIVLRTKDWCVQRRAIAWMMLIIFCLSAVPLTALAQQIAVTAVTGTLLLNGQECQQGAIVTEGALLETLADETAIVELSDGSRFEIGEQTRLSVAKTVQTATATTIIRLKLTHGWVRAKPGQDAQAEGFIFDIETPNALIGVKLAKSDIEVGYAEQQQETVAIAYSADVRAEHLLSGEERSVPQGSTVLVQAESIQILEGTGRSKSSDTQDPEIFDKFTDTKTLLIVGGILAASSVTAAVIDEETVEKSDFIGNFEHTGTALNGDTIHAIFSFTDTTSADLQGRYHFTQSGPDCHFAYERDVRGELIGSRVSLTVYAVTYTENCQSGTADVALPVEIHTCTLTQEKKVLRCTGSNDNTTEYQRQ